MRSILVAAALGLFFTVLGTPVAIRLFRVIGWGQRVREPGPHYPQHHEKMGTPTMGGVVIIGAMVVAYLVSAVVGLSPFTRTAVLVLLTAVGFGLVGFIDDLLKIRRADRHSLGIGKTAKVLGQAGVAVLFALGLTRLTAASTELSFIRSTGIDLGTVAFVVWVFVILASTSNAVNLTDGLDGLASGSAALVMAAFVFIAFWQFRHTCEALTGPGCYDIDVNTSLDLAIVAAGALGAIAGFLWWNAAPARIFMGDTGSLAIGGMIGAMAVATNTQLLLIILGGLYVLETTSVILQVISFRLLRRRVFRMAPIHHHFEVLGWHEFTVIVRFWIIAGLAVAFGLGLFYADFLARGGIQ
ncbi:MAG TPA: phospho-N-acetylmuramoyl-pentapeptide-transferase [Actinomycetota bacterium]|jgi:phospho-N-acetylmuramoyl-pentapeptide-transferase|nr:phospho-N-acetylmuramoyl-pentapeptide-transferase [Actinomycetota bacterium]